ncbi:dTMP kinase [Vibrio sp. JC009]|uniref:dTMP kinase n=1 Tax=Vibrio sp. JC009 TaxID=2912314 RepID=UPI0023B12DAC|nr:dTMP kinase [Vibrio sp. JC009]WED22688.1 dTMP kinase [Vibrio sp. JC009]
MVVIGAISYITHSLTLWFTWFFSQKYGAGKSTAIAAIESVLNQHGIENISKTREPGGTPLAEKMRSLIKEEHEGEELKDISELLLLYAARAQLVENVIKPALEKGNWVIGDRHDMSSQAYQGGGRQLDKTVMGTLKDVTLAGFKPDLTLYLDIDPKLGLERARGRGELDRIEKMDISFFERTRERYLELASSDETVITVNAGQTIEAVTADIVVALENWLKS